jgi:hypothetical protein
LINHRQIRQGRRREPHLPWQRFVSSGVPSWRIWLRILKFSPASVRLGQMGRTYHFQCTQCQYHADLSGGADSGLHCDVQTILCRECRELFDVFTRARHEVGCMKFVQNFSAFKRLEIPPVILRDSLFAAKSAAPRQFEWEKLKLACPVSATHFVEPWRHPGRCPRCYAFMAQDGLPFRIWE